MKDKAIRDKYKGKIRVAELFAGVGGFRLGLEKRIRNHKLGRYVVEWSNQFEPGKSKAAQHASRIYVQKFGNIGHSNEDISKVKTNDIEDHDLLVGGFPCQDYSVARTLSQAEGIVGKKGVLWWQIERILREKAEKAPDFLMLENVDRLIKSPASQRGRDFALMLASLADLNYAVEWRIINAADYGMPQRRRRIYILGYKKGTSIHHRLLKTENKLDWLLKEGVFAKAFKVTSDVLLPRDFLLDGTLGEITENFNINSKKSLFENSGVMVNKRVVTAKVTSIESSRKIVLGDIIEENESLIPEEYFIDEKKELGLWLKLKGSKNETRVTKDGFTYTYTEGSMVFPDPLNKPSRTIVTGEGGRTPSRFKHAIKTKSGRLRRLTPEELERLNMFEPGHTKGASDTTRAFFMGNALVVGVIERTGRQLLNSIYE